MILCILKVIVLVFFVYGVYSTIMLIFDIKDSKRYRRCVYIDIDKVSNIEDAVYTELLNHPDTEIYIVQHSNTDPDNESVISALCRKYDLVYSIKER